MTGDTNFYDYKGETCIKHSTYKGFAILRAWDVFEGHGKMRYFAIGWIIFDGKRHTVELEAKNLQGIKSKITFYETFERAI